MKIRLSRAELALFLVPAVVFPLAVAGNRWKIANTPFPTPIPTATPTPIPNFFRGAGRSNQIPIASRDGRRIITHPDSGRNGVRFAVWNAKTGDLVRRFGSFRGGVGNKAPILSPNGQLVLFDNGGYQYDRLVLLDVSTGRQLRQWKRKGTEGYGVALSNDYLATLSNDDVRLHSVKSGALVKKLRHRARDYYPTHPNFSPDGERICWIGFSTWEYEEYASGSKDNEIVSFDVARGQRIWRRAFPHVHLIQIRHTGDGKTLVARGDQYFWTKSRKGKALSAYRKIWGIDALTGTKLWEKHAEYGGNEIPVSPDGKWIALTLRHDDSSGNARIAICEARTGKQRGEFLDSFTEVFWSADSSQIWTSANERVVLQKGGSWSAPQPIKPQFPPS
ncbi:MAG TPA: WD40 repeat domain-containing protein [Abditibacterium sp.]|jgi:outer membrane protein assembly factor BamB